MNAILLSLAVLLTGADPVVEASKSAQTRIYVRTIPPGAQIILDGEKTLGASDGLFLVPPGVRKLTIEMDGYDPEVKRVKVREGWITRVEVTLEKNAKPKKAVTPDPFKTAPIVENQLPSQSVTRKTADKYIPKGYRAVSMNVSEVTGGSGKVEPGDRVNVLVHLTKNPDRGILEDGVKTIFENIKVFSIDDSTISDDAFFQTVFLLVTPEQGDKLLLAQHLGKIELVLIETDRRESKTIVPRESPSVPFSVVPSSTSPSDPFAEPPAEVKIQAKGREILERMIEANRYWLIGPPESVKSYEFLYKLKKEEPKTYTIPDASKARSALLQGTTYYSPLHEMAMQPEDVTINKVDANEETITLEYSLPEPMDAAYGNGIEGHWYGYFERRAGGGTLVLDAKTLTPRSHRILGAEEKFSEFKELEPGVYVPAKIEILSVQLDFEWLFQVREHGLWILQYAQWKKGDGSMEPLVELEVTKINGKEVVHSEDGSEKAGAFGLE